MTSISKNVYIDKLDDIINEYNNTYHSTIKMKLIDIKSSTYIDFSVESNHKDTKFVVGDHVRIAEKKVNDHITSYTKLINDLSGEAKLISIKKLTKDLING